MGVKSFVEESMAAVVAGSSTHSLDLVKVRMQLQGEAAAAGSTSQRLAGPVEMGMRIVRDEGPQGLFAGVSATVLRQGLYSTTRMRLYDNFKALWTDDRGRFPFIRKVAAALISVAVKIVLKKSCIHLHADTFILFTAMEESLLPLSRADRC